VDVDCPILLLIMLAILIKGSTVPTTTHFMPRIQRHFRPLTLRTTFGPERLLTPPPSTSRTAFPPLESLAETPESPASVPLQLIKKPAGEVGKSYMLFDASRLDAETFKDIEVELSLTLLFITFTKYVADSCKQTGGCPPRYNHHVFAAEACDDQDSLASG
jgi:hypothetical protein